MMSVIKYGLSGVLINALILSIPLTAQAGGGSLAVNAHATIVAGTCYFDTSELNLDFKEVFPATIASTTKTSRPYVDASVGVTSDTTNPDYSQRHKPCDYSTEGMIFSIDSEGNSAMGVDGDNILTLIPRPGSTDDLASGFGIAIYKLDGSNEIPIGIDANTDVGSPGAFTLRARLVPLQGKSAQDITGGEIYSQAILNISYK